MRSTTAIARITARNITPSPTPLIENRRWSASRLVGSGDRRAGIVIRFPRSHVSHHASTIQSPPDLAPMANRSWSSRTIWNGLTRFAIGTNHQPIDQRGVTDGLPPPSTGTLSTVRLSQAKYEIAVSTWAPREPKPTSAVDRSKLL